MGKDLNEGNFRKKYLMVDKFSKVTYIKDQRKFLENDLYIGPEGVVWFGLALGFKIFYIHRPFSLVVSHCNWNLFLISQLIHIFEF